MIARLRRATLTYVAALTISAGIVAVPSPAGRRRPVSPVVRVHTQALVDGRWAAGEVSFLDPRQIVTLVVDDSGEPPRVISPN